MVQDEKNLQYQKHASKTGKVEEQIPPTSSTSTALQAFAGPLGLDEGDDVVLDGLHLNAVADGGGGGQQ